MQRAFIAGVAGAVLTSDERAFLRAARPAGLILFARNCKDGAQIRRLVDSFRDAVGGSDNLVLIDQEGGRVQRLRPPLSRALPPAAAYGALYAQDAAEACRTAYLAARLTAADLAALGIDTNCAPVLDIPVPGAHDIIGNRAYGPAPEVVVALGRAVARGHMDGGVVPVIKHIPGHGRAGADSHLALPVVDTDAATLRASDFAPFRALADLPAAMTAHVVYADLDRDHPATTSPRVIGEVIRRDIGFDGLLMSDDLSMKALTGALGARCTASLAAGCDLALHCNGVLAEMEAVAAAAPALTGTARRRFDAALAVRRRNEPFDTAAAEAALAGALAVVA